MGTDLTSAIIGLQEAKTMGSVQIAVARKILDAQRSDGAGALELLNAATNGMNQAGDSLVAAATGLGGQLDTWA